MSKNYQKKKKFENLVQNFSNIFVPDTGNHCHNRLAMINSITKKNLENRIHFEIWKVDFFSLYLTHYS